MNKKLLRIIAVVAVLAMMLSFSSVAFAYSEYNSPTQQGYDSWGLRSWPTINQGNASEAKHTKLIQQYMNYRYYNISNQSGYSDLIIDGNYGSKTKARVKQFQQQTGISADGITGSGTWNGMCRQSIRVSQANNRVNYGARRWSGSLTITATGMNASAWSVTMPSYGGPYWQNFEGTNLN